MEELLRKKYNIELEFFGEKNKPLKISFQYEQGSFRDVLLIKEDLAGGMDIVEWLFYFLMKKTIQSDKLTKELFEQLSDSRIADIIDFVFNTYAKDFFEKSKEKKKEEDPFKDVKAPSSSLICLLLEKTNEKIETLLDMTWEQIRYLIDGIIWNLNAATKDGQKKNESGARMKMMKEELSDDAALESVRKLEKRIEEKKNKSKK